MKVPEDKDLGRYFSLIVSGLVLSVIYLVLTLPVAKSPEASAIAIGSLTTLVGGIIAARAYRRSRERSHDDE